MRSPTLGLLLTLIVARIVVAPDSIAIQGGRQDAGAVAADELADHRQEQQEQQFEQQFEQQELLQFYHALRNDAELTHDEAIQDSVVSLLMSPGFLYRMGVNTDQFGDATAPLSDF